MRLAGVRKVLRRTGLWSSGFGFAIGLLGLGIDSRIILIFLPSVLAMICLWGED